MLAWGDGLKKLGAEDTHNIKALDFSQQSQMRYWLLDPDYKYTGAQYYFIEVDIDDTRLGSLSIKDHSPFTQEISHQDWKDRPDLITSALAKAYMNPRFEEKESRYDPSGLQS
jgi:hypothetical protein